MLDRFFAGDNIPDGHSYILVTHITSDIIIALAYLSISIGIMIFVRKHKDIKNLRLLILFGLFFVFYLVSIVAHWYGLYDIHSASKVATALVSILTTMYLFRLLPQALNLPSNEQFEGMTSDLLVQTNQNIQLKLEIGSQKLAHMMLKVIPIGGLLVNRDGIIELANQSVINDFDLDEEQLFRDSILNFFIPTDPNFESMFQNFLKHHTSIEESLSFLGDVRAADGHRIPTELTLTRIPYEGEVMFVVSLQNLSEIAKVKSELIESHQRLERSVNANEDGIWEWDVQTNQVQYSDIFCSLIGKDTSEDATYDDWFEHIHPSYREKFSQAIQQHFETKEKYSLEYLGLNSDGQYHWYQVIGNSIFDADGHALVMSGSLRCIDDIKQVQAAEQEKTNFLNAIYEGSQQAIWALEVLPDKEFRFVEYNQTALERSGGVSKDEVVGKTLTELAGNIFDLELVESLRNNYLRCLESAQNINYIEKLNFEKRWFQTTLYPVFDSKGVVTHIIGSAIDISDQMLVKEELDAKKSYLEAILNSAVCGVYIYDLKTNANIEINQRYTDITGYTLEDLKMIDDFSTLFHVDEWPRVINHMQEVASSGAGELIQLEYRFKHKEGHWVWCYSFDSIITRDEEGVPLHMLGTFIDVTEKNALLQQLADSNAYLERFAFVASHDLQEPLRKISAFSDSLSETLQDKLDSDTERYELSRISDAASRMRTMIKDILALSRINRSGIKFDVTLVKQLIDDALADNSLMIRDSGAIIEVNAIPERIKSDSSLLKQAIQNLIHNAIKFTPSERVPHVKIDVQVKGEWNHISVTDNGIGIEERYWQEIFDPFRRLHSKEAYEGSGIGLSLVKQVMVVHNGLVRVLNSSDKGTTFELKFPRRLNG